MCGLLFELSSSSFIVLNMNQTSLPVKGLELKVGPKIICILFVTIIAFSHASKVVCVFFFLIVPTKINR